MLSGFAIPGRGFAQISGHAPAAFVQNRQVELRTGVAFFGGFAKPFGRLGIVPGDALAFTVSKAEINLAFGIAGLGGFAIPTHSFDEIGASRPATGVKPA